VRASRHVAVSLLTGISQEAVRRSKDPTVFTVLFEDSAALIGLVIALIGIALAEILEMPRLDGIASLGIGQEPGDRR
jgi:hypothetical protein